MTSFGEEVDFPKPDRFQRASQAVLPLPRDYGYDIALSFAGEDREVARIIANAARANGLRVFFDEYHVWETWGKDLSDYLGSIYGGGARYCVILISADYCRKPYTIFERRIALARSIESEEEYVLPVVLDDSWPSGLPRTTAYLDLRIIQPKDVADAVIRKIKGPNWEIRCAEGQPVPELEVLEKDVSAFPDAGRSTWSSLIDFADVAVARECHLWAEGDPYVRDSWSSEAPRWSFRGGFGTYEDPIFDITIINRSDAPRLITRIGIEALGASYKAYDGLGGGPTEPVLLHRTYQIPMPDLWLTLAEGQRAAGRSPETLEFWDRFSLPWIDAEERCSCRLPDPILVDPGRAYRFGLHLFDYTNLCPTEVELLFWMQTDQGEAKSERARLSYFIGSGIEPMQRYFRMLEGSLETEKQKKLKRPQETARKKKDERTKRIAHDLWEGAGRPSGRDQEFWAIAEHLVGEDPLTVVGEDPLIAEYMNAARKRSL
jgi:hypothetical protein